MQLYGERGSYVEDVHYADYQDFQGTRYPSRCKSPAPSMTMGQQMTIQKATFNQEITPDKFELKKPANAELIELGAASKAEGGHGE